MRRTWRPAVVVHRMPETPSAHTLIMKVDGWDGHLPGQHVDLRLTAEDGYQATRSYSLAAPTSGDQIAITVQKTPRGEVSPFLVDEVAVGDYVEVRGPLGGWFVLRSSDRSPAFLIGGGSGIVPLMSMVRARVQQASAPVRLLCSVRTPDERLYSTELERLSTNHDSLDVHWLYTRSAPPNDTRPAGRLSPGDLEQAGFAPDLEPMCFVCGPTGFVEATAALLVAAGHNPGRILTERFGGA